jgi:hypothetical protein
MTFSPAGEAEACLPRRGGSVEGKLPVDWHGDLQLGMLG